MPELQLIRPDHAPALLVFERENRAYFAASVPDRGDEFFTEFDARLAQLLEWQAAGTDYLHVLVAGGGEVVGRVNLVEVADGSAELGFRIAQKAARRGLATAAVREVRELGAVPVAVLPAMELPAGTSTGPREHPETHATARTQAAPVTRTALSRGLDGRLPVARGPQPARGRDVIMNLRQR